MEKQKLKVPELPKGYFFRVSESRRIGYLRVELRKKFLVFSYEVFFEDPTWDNKESIHMAMRKLSYSLERELKKTSYVGDYPPKTLG